MTAKRYIMLCSSGPDVNFLVKEEFYKSGCIDHIGFYVMGIDEADDGNTWALVSARYQNDKLEIDLISVLPDYQGLGIEMVILNTLSERYRTRCLPANVLTDEEEEIWAAYRSRPVSAPSAGYLQNVGVW